MNSPDCILCNDKGDKKILETQDNRKAYFCSNCYLIYVDPEFYPSKEEERSRYLQHENSPENEGYVQFLRQVTDPVLGFLKKGMEGIDYGCGPGPVISGIMRESGMYCFDYDPLFFPDLPQFPLDFVFATECFEHFFNPRFELETISGLIKPKGILGIMTSLWADYESFSTWYYTRDNTHVCFYHKSTFDYICNVFKYKMLFSDERRVIILQKV